MLYFRLTDILHKVKHIEIYLPTFKYILAHSCIFRILTYSCILGRVYLEPMAYSGIFGTIDMFNQFQANYSGITPEQFMHILNLI